MGMSFLVVLLLIALCATALYFLLRSMGNDGIEAAAPGSCRSGRCGVMPKKPEIVGEIGRQELGVYEDREAPAAPPLIDEISRPDARSPHQTL